MVGEFIAHDSSSQFGSLNHAGLAESNAPGPVLARRLRAKADITPPTIPAGTVENDPEPTSPVEDFCIAK
jgi:hypothetical protein